MSRRTSKAKKLASTKKRKKLLLAKRRKQTQEKHKKSDSKIFKQQASDNLVGQLKQQETPTFDRSAWQTSQPSKNISHSPMQGAVLNGKVLKVDFDKTAWGPPSEDIVEVPEPIPKIESIKAGFDPIAWTPPNVEKNEEITTVDTGKCSG